MLTEAGFKRALAELRTRPLGESWGRIRRRLRIDGGLQYHVGSTLANQLGYQVFRSLYTSARWHLRDHPVGEELKAYVEALERDGCISLPDFLPPEVFRAIRAEYDASLKSLKYETWVVEDNNVVEEMIDLSFYPGKMPMTEAALVNNVMLRTIVAGALRRPIGAYPRVWSKRWYKSEVPLKPRALGHVIGANYLHADMHYPTFKAFYYLNDVDETNGAFVFSMGSHRMTPFRLAYEYDSSVRASKVRQLPDSADIPAGLARLPRERQLAEIERRAVSMNGKANTLIIANTQGFHRQGDFELGRTREAIQFCFRTAEPGFIMGKRLDAPKTPGME